MNNLTKKTLLLLTTTLVFGFSTSSFAETNSAQKDGMISMEKSQSAGCWVTFFDKKNFRGKRATLFGFQSIYDLELEDIVGDDPDSIIVGPRAKIYLFDGEGFDDLKYYFQSNTRVRSLNGLKNIDSLQINCY